jgi:hypothetical protein
LAVPNKPQPRELPEVWTKETFAPVLNVAVFDEIEQAIEWNNAVPQGLSSSLWTRDMRNVGKWIGPSGSDAGIVNVRIDIQMENDLLSRIFRRLMLELQERKVGTIPKGEEFD